ncbi:hypothetical protein WA026_008325 [Henosepilachna vigintioctopunctata]|uniref:Uncharacterized protein n=1 Tax=Henosepilachna vigintioctopunctata TaxID=420089 RepID=A0AAW1U7W0_9CUCU
MEMLNAEIRTQDMVSVPASPPESNSRKQPTACIAKNQESTVREEASTSCATPKSSFGSTSTEKCSPIHEINAATVREEASTSCVTPESSFGSTSTEKCSTIHEIDAAKIAFMFQLCLVTHEEHRKMSLIIDTTTNRRSKRKKRSTENENFVYSYSTAKKTNTTLKKKKYLTV